MLEATKVSQHACLGTPGRFKSGEPSMIRAGANQTEQEAEKALQCLDSRSSA